MADFVQAFEKVILGYEGRYGHHGLDRGGETYMGIARKIHPNWEGWVSIDRHKRQENFPALLDTDTPLQRMVREFYMNEYWSRFWGDQQPEQDLANEMFDQAVLHGPAIAVEFVQRGANVLNRRQLLYKNIVVDRWYGGVTHGAVLACLRTRPRGSLLKVLNILQGAYVLAIAERDESQEEFLLGWLKRVSP